MNSTAHVSPVGASYEDFLNLSDEAKVHVRHRFVASAFAQLPGLTREERDQARDRMLASECALWRVRFREVSKELEHEKRRAEMLEQSVANLQLRMTRMLASMDPNQPAESPAAST